MKSTLCLLAGLSVLASACWTAGADSKVPPPRIATQYIVGIDISGSRSASQLHEEEEVLQGLIQRMDYGDRLVLVETYRTGIDSAGQWQDSIPYPKFPNKVTGHDKEKLEQFKVVAAQIASTFFDPEKSKEIKSTDLFHTLTRAADYATAANGRKTTVVLLSDMLQSTAEVNMERDGGIPDDSWIYRLKAEGRLPRLDDVCVFVVGADPRLTDKGAKVRQFWEHYFRAANAIYQSENYRNMIADPAEIRCN